MGTCISNTRSCGLQTKEKLSRCPRIGCKAHLLAPGSLPSCSHVVETSLTNKMDSPQGSSATSPSAQGHLTKEGISHQIGGGKEPTEVASPLPSSPWIQPELWSFGLLLRGPRVAPIEVPEQDPSGGRTWGPLGCFTSSRHVGGDATDSTQRHVPASPCRLALGVPPRRLSQSSGGPGMRPSGLAILMFWPLPRQRQTFSFLAFSS
mmetsp:Transcript_11027/g.31636  ORF Transcript_11027/g.31636 Transcript_11027/m.31636 type:complete len:206 (-) Transcript_11027:329-946(-)